MRVTGLNLPEGIYRIRNVDSGLVLQLEGASRVRVGPDGPPAPRPPAGG